MQIGSGKQVLPGGTLSAGSMGTSGVTPPPLDAVVPVVAPDARLPESRAYKKILLGVLLVLLLVGVGVLAVGRGAFGGGVAKVQALVRSLQDFCAVKVLGPSRGEGGEARAVPRAAVAATVPTAAAPAVGAPAGGAETPAVQPVRPANPSATVAALSNPVAGTEKPFVWPAIKITAVIGNPQTKSFARINGRLVSQGDKLDSLTVVAIVPQCVTLAASTGERRNFYVGTNQ